ncbi:TIGR04076 family protein [uncultured Dubosiella sp.]|uniref:TIGR04076 family protein n=1 Tax=uncultured Dubosiella sp. TaxID=1937011 RepID=UPI00258BE89A|nr:TIGR04076 family protein [uncultured Dubosiella sp.]
MKTIRITAMKQVEHRDLMERFENELEEACTIEVGQSWIVENLRKPEGFCDSAWQTIYPFAMTLAYGGGDIYEGWMKDKHTVMLSCNDGFRPVSFYVEALD